MERCDQELQGSGLTPGKRKQPEAVRLTPQELAVAHYIAGGMSTRDAAVEMAISIKTVQFHLGNIYSKLGVRTRLQLANRVREGLETATEAVGDS